MVCVAIRSEAPDSVALERVLRDPPIPLLRRLQEKHRGVLPVSACEIVTSTGPGSFVRERGSTASGLILWVQELQTSGRRGRIGYFAHGLAAGEWECRFAQEGARWYVRSCDVEWVA